MSWDTALTLVIVLAAVLFVALRAVRTMRTAKKRSAAGPGCDNCGHG